MSQVAEIALTQGLTDFANASNLANHAMLRVLIESSGSMAKVMNSVADAICSELEACESPHEIGECIAALRASVDAEPKNA